MSLRLPEMIAATIAVTLCVVVTSARAEVEDAACARILMASLTQTEPESKFRIELLNRGHVDTDRQYLAGETTYDLRAVETGSGREVAVAACTVRDGAVVAMLFDQSSIDLRAKGIVSTRR